MVRSIDHDAWRVAYLAEIEAYGAQTQGRVLNSVFFGGGTPSLMEPETVQTVFEAIRATWTVANDLEVTLEANPGSVETGRFAAYRDAGVNRVSMGIQALDDKALKRLGRLHTKTEALKAFDIARATFDRVSFDLIYGRQDQTLDDWRHELREALALAVDHLSLYQLTIEDGTAFGDRYKAGKLRGLPDEDRAADLYELTQDMTGTAGMPAYEVSNHARAGAMSRHNLIYWRYGDYIGIGPGAHGRLTLEGKRFATVHQPQPQPWLNGRRETERTSLSPEEQAEEMALMGLRLAEGIALPRLAALRGAPLPHDQLKELEELGLVERPDGHLILTKQGLMVMDAILPKLFA